MNQSVSLTTLETCLGIQQKPRFCRGISKFSSVCLGKENTLAVKFLRILKNTFPRKKYIFVQKGQEMFRFIKKLFLSFTRFSHLFS